MRYKYQIFIPGGNDTALVFGIEENPDSRRIINNSIMSRFPNVEQVGFISENINEARLIMAGGEFCGNATRSAAWHYLEGAPGVISIDVSGVKKPLLAGVTDTREAWAQMPVENDINSISEIATRCFLVNLEGIKHVVVFPESPFNAFSVGNLKSKAFEILKKYELLNFPAAGVIYLQTTAKGIKIHPCVRVSAIDTMFYETACGSGTIATGLVYAHLSGSNMNIPIIQPSGHVISAIVNLDGKNVAEARISGYVKTDNIVHTG